jgi:vancomycin aglycone glucosyltransferase
MRVLLSTYDSRGGVEPLLGLAVSLRELGAEVRMCAPPDCATLTPETSARATAVAGGIRTDGAARAVALLADAANRTVATRS